MKKLCSTIIVLFAILANALSETIITGKVYESGSPIVGAAVFIEGTTIGDATDEFGTFKFHYKGDFPINIIIKCIGYEEKLISINGTQTSNLSIELTTKTEDVKGIDVIGNKHTTNFESIDALTALTTAGVSGGIESVLTSQMGVSTNSELSSQYRVRGGNFDENMIYVNGIEIYRPFLIRAGEQEGLSFVNPDMVESLNFSSGGFDVSYGDRMSSVLDVKYKAPKSFGGSARASLLGGSAHIEGVSKNYVFAHTTGIRYKSNKYIFGSLDTSGDYDPSFFDIQTFWTLKPTDKLQIDILGYYANNKYRFRPKDRETTFGTINEAKKLTIYFEGKENDKYQTGIVALSATTKIASNTKLTFATSMYRSSETEKFDILGEYWLQQAEASSTIENFNESEGIGVGGYLQHARNELFGQIYSFYLRGTTKLTNHQLRYEIKYQTETFNDYVDEWEYRDSAGYIAPPTTGIIDFDNISKGDNKLNSSRIQAYFLDSYTHSWPNSKLTIDYGVRISNWSKNGETLISPRASMRLNKNNMAYRMSVGIYNQSPLFRELRNHDGSLNENIKAQQSWQVVGGFDYFFETDGRPFKLTLEAYYKGLRNINPYNIDNVRIRYMADNCAKGYATGLDIKINGELVEGVESWACLSLMKTVEDIDNDGTGYIPRPSDQRVSFSSFLQDYLPLNKSVGATLSLYMSTGLPFGPPNCERSKATNRMPGYKRVDLGMFKDFARKSDGTSKIKNISSLRLGLEVFNLFDFNNTISYFWVNDVDNRQYAVPNYLTSRRLNIKFSIEF